jgi:DNA (cytosine-5)-methyltransferase 1
MKHGSLFSGIGGFDLGFEYAGMTTAWQVENDKMCNRVLKRWWPSVPRRKDVKDVNGSLGAVDVISGGFPCQDLSIAGRREGLSGSRSALWWEFLRVIQTFEPGWVVIENVPGLLSSYSGDKPPSNLQAGETWETKQESDLAIIVRGLAECGYWWAYRVLDLYYWGVPHKRRRVFIVASNRDGRRPEQVLFERHSSPWDTPQDSQAWQEDAPCPACGFSTSGPRGVTTYAPSHHYNWVPSNVAATLQGRPNRQRGDMNLIVFDRTTGIIHGDAAGTLRSMSAKTPGVNPGKADSQCVLTKEGVRKLTPLECERLQGFPDRWTLVGKMSDTARYRMLGNAVGVPVVEWIGHRLMNEEERCQES